MPQLAQARQQGYRRGYCGLFEVKWLVVGAGGAGRCHIAAIAHTADAVLSGVVDPHTEPVIGVNVFKDILSAVQESMPDAAIVATPNNSHVRVALDLIGHRIPTLIEKPVGTSLSDAETILSQATQSGVPTGVVLNQRVQAHIRWVTQQIQSGKFAPASVEIKGAPLRLGGWHAEKSHGGGLMRLIGLHYLDLLLLWFGTPSGTCVSDLSDNSFDVSFTFSSGCKGRLTLRAAEPGETSPVEITLSGSNARVHISGHTATDFEGLEAPMPAEDTLPGLAFGPGHLTIISEATKALQRGDPFPIPLGAVLPAIRLVDEINSVAP